MAVASDGPYISLHALQTDNHTSTPPLSFYRPDALPAAQPTASKLSLLNLIFVYLMHFVLAGKRLSFARIRFS